jgi:hypothetical protein
MLYSLATSQQNIACDVTKSFEKNAWNYNNSYVKCN